MKRIILAGLVAALLPGLAVAQSRRPPLTGNPVQDIKNAVTGVTAPTAPGSTDPIAQALTKVFQDIANLIGSDIDGAIKLSTEIPTLQDGNGQQCWMGMQEFGQIVKAHPLPLTGHAVTDLEAARLLTMSANKLCSNVHCNQVFTDLAAAVQKASIAPGIAIPSLSAICTQLPTVAVAPAVTVPAPATQSPTTTVPAAPAANP